MDELLEVVGSEQATRVFQAYWPWILAGLAVVIKWVRSRSLHWTLWPKATKILGLILEILDFIHIPKMRPTKGDFEQAERIAYNQRNPEKRRRISERVNAIKTKTGEYPKVTT